MQQAAGKCKSEVSLCEPRLQLHIGLYKYLPENTRISDFNAMHKIANAGSWLIETPALIGGFVAMRKKYF
jgi:hypothetical protein